jgi:hypothetical protein
MKIQIVHDRSGSILAALAASNGERRGVLSPLDETQTFAEIDVPDGQMSDAELRGDEPSPYLSELIERYRFIDGRLVERTEKQGA